MPEWIDFKELRKRLSFAAVLQHYRVEVKFRGEQHQGFCPLPGHDGKGRSPSFSANLRRGIFQCFGCGAKGNVLDFAALMEGCDPGDRKGLHRVAADLAKRFVPDLSSREPPDADSDEAARPPERGNVVVNAPLDFELRGLDYQHPYLRSRGFTEETIRHFGLGVAQRGLLKDRLAIPLHDPNGRLIGYAGRVVDDSSISPENPRYRFPSRRERSGSVHEFRKSLFLYNGHRVASPVEDLIVAEGFTAVWWLEQHGFAPAVATMGSDCSEEQARLIVSLVRSNGRIWLIPDGDAAGLRHAQAALAQIAPHRFVRWVKLENQRQPTDLPPDELKSKFTL